MIDDDLTRDHPDVAAREADALEVTAAGPALLRLLASVRDFNRASHPAPTPPTGARIFAEVLWQETLEDLRAFVQSE